MRLHRIVMFIFLTAVFPAAAWASPGICKAIYLNSRSIHSSPRFELQNQADPAFISRGDRGLLRLTNGDTFQDTIFAGAEFEKGRERYIFIASGKSEYTVVRIFADDLKLPVTANPKDIILLPSEQTRGTCGAHATAACIMALNPELPKLLSQNEGRQAEQMRQALIQNAESKVYDLQDASKIMQSKIETFLQDHQVTTDSMLIHSKESREEFLTLMQNRTPVILIYGHTRAQYLGLEKYIDGNGEKTQESSYQWFEPANSWGKSGHAVLAVGVMDLPGGDRRVLVLDSATQKLQLWYWSEFEKSRQVPIVALFPSQQKTVNQGLSPQSRRAVISKFGSQDAFPQWLLQNPDLVRQVRGQDQTFEHLKKHDWVLVHNHATMIKEGLSEVIAGKVVDSGISSEGLHSLTIREYRSGKLSKKETTLFPEFIRELYRLVPSADTPGSLHAKTLAFSSSRPGDPIQFMYSSSPEQPPIFIFGLVISRGPQELHVFDQSSNELITLGRNDFISQVSYQPTKNASFAPEKSILQAQIKLILNRFASEDKKASSTRKNKLKAQLQDSNIVHPLSTENSFSVQALPTGSRVVILLKDVAFHYTHRYPEGQKVGEATVIRTTADELIVRLQNGLDFTLNPEHVEAILRLKDSPVN